MINLRERMLPTLAGVEPATWSPVGRRIQLSHRGRPDRYQTMKLIISKTRPRKLKIDLESKTKNKKLYLAEFTTFDTCNSGNHITDYNFGYKKKKKLPVGRPPGGHTNLENGPKIPAKRGRKRKRFHLIHKKSHTAPIPKTEGDNEKEQEDGSVNGENGDEGFIDDDRSGDNDVDNDEENSKLLS